MQTAAKLMLEPMFEADVEDSAYGYRPRRSAQDAKHAGNTREVIVEPDEVRQLLVVITAYPVD